MKLKLQILPLLIMLLMLGTEMWVQGTKGEKSLNLREDKLKVLCRWWLHVFYFSGWQHITYNIVLRFGQCFRLYYL